MVHVRKMSEADVEAVSAIRVRGWQTAYAGILPGSYLEAMTVESDADQRRQWFSLPHRQSVDLVAVDAGVPVGWINYGPFRSGESGEPGVRTGEINALYVRPDLTGRGIGRALLGEAHAWLRSQEYRAAVLWVLDGNRGARRFYERAGYRADGPTQTEVYDGLAVAELRYRHGW
ncbi:N-acetyltransferase family protein [Streptomyces sp. NPDC001571]|nr:GNAT family N-acetyltransferase [Streptomyces sp. MAG02]